MKHIFKKNSLSIISLRYLVAAFLMGRLSFGGAAAGDRVAFMTNSVNAINAGVVTNTVEIHRYAGRVKYFEGVITDSQNSITSLNKEIASLKNDPNPANANLNADKMALKQTEIDQLNEKIAEAKKALDQYDPDHNGSSESNKGLKAKLADEIKTRESLLRDLDKAKMDLAKAEGRAETASSNSQAASKLEEASNLRRAAKELEQTNPKAAEAMRRQADKLEQGVDKITDARYLQADGDPAASAAIEKATNDLAKMEPWNPDKMGTPVLEPSTAKNTTYTRQLTQGATPKRSLSSISRAGQRNGLIHSFGRLVFGRRR